MSAAPSLIDQVRGVISLAEGRLAGTPAVPQLDALSARLDEPLRVAIAGRVKAGKSTLLNALVGQELAPTDAGECTRIVTWYRDGVTYRVTLYPLEGEPLNVPFSQNGGAIKVDLAGFRPEHVDRLVVDWPSTSLKAMTLIDTPGIASLSADLSERAVAFLTGTDDQPTASDAVLYLMHHLHSTDVRFLDAFRDQEVAHPAPINTVAVLSRADEIGAGKLDALTTAARIAGRYRLDPKVRSLCQTVIPVAALLAQSAETLEEEEYKALARITAGEKPDINGLLLSVDRFLKVQVGTIQIGPRTREHLLRRFGLFGVRLAVALIAEGKAPTADALARELVARSGLVELRGVLLSQFAARRDVLKARAALIGLHKIIQASETPTELAAEIERIESGAHEFAEIRLLNVHRSGAITFRPDEAEEVDRLLGAAGTSVTARLGLPRDAGPGDIREALGRALSRWRARAENPLSSPEVVAAANVLVRTCEGMLAALSSTG
jgi:50S ribosome-binding GTPase